MLMGKYYPGTTQKVLFEVKFQETHVRITDKSYFQHACPILQVHLYHNLALYVCIQISYLASYTRKNCPGLMDGSFF